MSVGYASRAGFVLTLCLMVGTGCARRSTPLPPVPAPPAPPAQAPAPVAKAGQLEAGVYRAASGAELPYQLFHPAEQQPGELYPLVVFLHGSSGSGSDNERQLTGSRQAGVATWTDEEMQRRHPAFVLAPQADPRLAPTWVQQWRKPEDGRADEPLELVVELLDELQQRLPIDPNRLYLTGYSMGGFGVWIGISRHPEKFAAAVPIAGGGDPSDVGDAEAAVWAFHGARDDVVPADRSREMIEALRAAGALPLYTEYPDEGHEIWERALSEPGLADWLFEQRR